MGFITALFLSYMPEDDAFWLLLTVLNEDPHTLGGMYRPGMERVLVLQSMLQVQCVAVACWWWVCCKQGGRGAVLRTRSTTAALRPL